MTYTVFQTSLNRKSAELFHADWDAIDYCSHLPSRCQRSTTSEYGFLLRHYWLDKQCLSFQIKTIQHQPGGNPLETTQTVSREMVRCNADTCVWRQKLISTNDWGKDTIRICPPFDDLQVCTYNRPEQTYRVRLPKYPKMDMSQVIEPRVYAMLQMPILMPLLPILPGFEWHVRRGTNQPDDYVSFSLEEVVHHKGMTLLFIRKEGCFSLQSYYQYASAREHEFRISRSGLTVYALELSLVLESRILDRYIPKYSNSPLHEMETLSIETLNSVEA